MLLAGCDKTVPAQLMGAASAGKPAIMLTAGPRSCGFFQGRSIVTTDIWDLAPDRFAGRIDDQEWDELEGTFAPTVGVCNVMGTATTMAIAAEVLGMALPGSATQFITPRTIRCFRITLRPSDWVRFLLSTRLPACSAPPSRR